MARANNILLENQAWVQSPFLSTSLAFGGQNGWMPDLREIHGWQQYVQRNARCLVVETPRFLNYLPNPEIWRESWRCLWEKHAKKISGFKQGLKASVTEQDAGGAGEKLQIVGDMKRDRTEPVTDFDEKEGRPIQRMLEVLMRFGLMDPNTKTALISTLIEAAAARGLKDLGLDVHGNGMPKDWLLDWFGGTILVYECDITDTRVDKATLTTNVWPHETGPIDMGRELTASKDLLELSIPWSGISDSSYAVVQVAQRLHDRIKKAHTSPGNNPAFIQDIEPILRSNKSGYVSQIEELHRNAIRKDGAAV